MSHLLEVARRLHRELARRARRAVAASLDPLRRGERTVIMTPRAGLRFGNLLYLWLQAHRRTANGEPTLALRSRAMEPWLSAFPELGSLTIAKQDVRFRDRREWDAAYLYQRFGVDFSADDITAFVRDTIAPHVVPDPSGSLVINIRRGDYYTEFYGKYAFDQVGYVRAALGVVGRAERAVVVSDDAEWCRANLGPILSRAIADVSFVEADPPANFLTVAGAKRIIGTNSTFTYWAAYVAGVVHPDVQIVMPRFHARMGDRTDAHQLDPRWEILDGFH